MRARAVILTSTLLGVVGCSSVSPMQIGQTAGAITGAAVAPGVGMPLGALVGTLAGMVFEQHLDKSREQREQAELTKQLSGAGSTHSPPQAPPDGAALTRVWVDEHVERGRLIAGHFDARPIQ